MSKDPRLTERGDEHRRVPAVISPEQVPLLSDHRATIIDIRPFAAWQEGHLERSRSIPLERLHAMTPMLDPSQLVILVSGSGECAKVEARRLSELGFVAAAVQGGLHACVAAGLPLIPGRSTE